MFKIKSIVFSSNYRLSHIYLNYRELDSNNISFIKIVNNNSNEDLNNENLFIDNKIYGQNNNNCNLSSINFKNHSIFDPFYYTNRNKFQLNSNKFNKNGFLISKTYDYNQYRKYSTLNYKQNKVFETFNKKSFIGSDSNRITIKSERFVTTDSSSKSILKSESQLKLAQIQSKSPINSFPLFKEENLNFVQFSDEFKELLELMKKCDENKLNNALYYPSVSTVLNTTMSVQSMAALDRWKKLKINELGDEGFKIYQKGLLSRGKLLHLNIKNFIQTKDSSAITLTENIVNLWKSLEHVFDYISDVKLCETPVSHPFLCYKGIVDCVALYNGKLAIIEWKTSEKLKPTLNHVYDNPLQAVAYLGAINFEVNHCLQANQIVLIYAYEDGSNAQIHHLNPEQCLKYWKQWLSRLKSYWNVIVFKQIHS